MSRRFTLAAIALIVLSFARIISTYTIFSATLDEPMHLSAGLEIYTQHAYTLQEENPPLPRLVLAFAPWIGDVKLDLARGIAQQLRLVFYSNDRYKTNLVLARVGDLLFFALASLAVWAWARRDLGPAGGLLALVLFTMQPVVIGHSGLATHDAAALAGVALSLLAFTRWLDEPSRVRALVFGAAFGFAILCKFSCIGYVPAACMAMTFVRMVRDPEARMLWRRMAPSFVAALVTALLVIWVGYGFTVSSFLSGISKLAAVDRAGHKSFLFGELRTTGWWFYFPVAVALKSTLASLVLALGALIARRERVALEALAAVAAILAVAMPSHLNLGVRYVLPLYAPLSVGGAAVALSMLQGARPVARAIVIAFLSWHAGASLVAHPDAFPYFNEAAGSRPWEQLSDSNIDWGQDVLRLREIAREQRIPSITTSILSTASLDHVGLPPRKDLVALQPVHGWVAISELHLALGRGVHPDVRRWVDDLMRGRPYRRVGTSIRLYFIE